MLVMTLEKTPPSLRGELTRWLIEIRSGVYVGTVSATVRDLLWDKVVQNARTGRCTQVFKTNNEQGFKMRMHGEQNRNLINIEGYELVAVENARYKELYPQLKQEEEDWGLM